MVANERIDIRLVAMLLGPMITAQWEKWEAIIRGTRDSEKNPGAWAGFEFLYHRWFNFRTKWGGPNCYSKGTLDDHYKSSQNSTKYPFF